ncbi:hypothetical protein GCM10008013_32650 [Paenibacillus segetis]|uniref:Uncharacterized protein n=1 Tax=Paenibacillus segetis TaxID=1325360 RepID=A0ABQ1YMS7_9BACL|nr:hypothetical protein GCM10008013_32650 [Paenibacillus segetis]
MVCGTLFPLRVRLTFGATVGQRGQVACPGLEGDLAERVEVKGFRVMVCNESLSLRDTLRYDQGL